MRVVEIIKTFTHSNTKYEVGNQFVMAEDIEAYYRSLYSDCLGMSHAIENYYRPYKGQDLNGKRLACWRTGGVG